jgi:hypothetical protein
VTRDQVIDWNPAIIIAQQRSFYDSLLRSTAWRGLIAVASKHVYLAPADPFGWIDGPPGVNRIIGLYWLTALFYPDQYQEDLRTNAREFYDKFYRVKLNDRQLESLVRPAEARAGETRRLGVPLLGAEPVPFPNAAPNAPPPSGRPPGRGGLVAPGPPSSLGVPANPHSGSASRRSRFGCPHKAEDPALWGPAHDGATGRIVGALENLVGGDREPGFADQCLVMVAFDAVLGGAAVRYRAAGDAGAGLDEAAEPRCEGGIGIWRRVSHGRAGEQHHRGKKERPHPRRRLSERAHAIS